MWVCDDEAKPTQAIIALRGRTPVSGVLRTYFIPMAKTRRELGCCLGLHPIASSDGRLMVVVFPIVMSLWMGGNRMGWQDWMASVRHVWRNGPALLSAHGTPPCRLGSPFDQNRSIRWPKRHRRSAKYVKNDGHSITLVVVLHTSARLDVRARRRNGAGQKSATVASTDFQRCRNPRRGTDVAPPSHPTHRSNPTD